MKTLKMIVLAVVLTLTSANSWAFQRGDQVYFLHGDNDSSLTVSRGKILNQYDSTSRVYFPEYNQTVRIQNSELYSSRTSAYEARSRRDDAHLSDGEAFVGGALLFIGVLCKMSGDC